ncbi:MAG: hypothetical protein H6Q61_1098 [Firmicutes bacterium]|nr:hypothetical protein [Bacillota bacterium]
MTNSAIRWLFVVLSLGLLLALLAVDLKYLPPEDGYETQDAVLERVIKKELVRGQAIQTDVKIYDSITLGDRYVAAYLTATQPPELGIMPFTLRKSLDSVTVKVREVDDDTMIYGPREKGEGIWEHGLALYQEGELYQYAIFLSNNPALSYVEWVVDGTAYHIPVGESPSMTVVQWAPYPEEELARFKLMGCQVASPFLNKGERPSGGMGISKDGMPENSHTYSFSFFTAQGERLGEVQSLE